jgi:hypothetical protein
MLKNLKEKAGYVSIETVIVAGLMITLGVFAITQLFDAGMAVTDSAMLGVNSALPVVVPEP